MKKKINYFILGSGVLTVIFAIFFDIIFKNPFFFGPSQLILLFFGLSLIFLFFSKKIFLVQLSFTIGILFVLINSNYFSITTKSPIVKEASTKINEYITDDEINELKRFLYKS